ncbi:aldo/keto reductase [Xylariales sp. PMI_506]|nr:aldo/keto reductase [Xylariales sp. PMI_506]
MSSGKFVTLSSGQKLPTLGYGTWQSSPGEVSVGVFEALKAGYRHLDLATIYENQKEVAQGLKKALKEIPGLKREDIFITSKLWNTQHNPAIVEASLDKVLADLEIEYLDLYLIHWPVTFPEGKNQGDDYFPLVAGKNEPDGDVEIEEGIPLADTWKAMTQLPKSKTRAVGVSNFSVPHIKAVIEATGVVPVVNQIERHPLLQQNDDLLPYLKENNIHLTAYSAFGNNSFGLPLILENPIVKEVAAKLNASPAQVLLAWSQVGGHSVIPKSVTPSRIQQNFQEIELSTEDFEKISTLGASPKRFNIPYTANKPRWDVNIFNDPSEKDATHQVYFKF